VKTPPLSDGDRVQVTEDWFQDELRKATGVILATPQDVEDRRDSGIYWVQFDWPMGRSVGATDAAEIDAKCLRRI
jgi:hypothetical protein